MLKCLNVRELFLLQRVHEMSTFLLSRENADLSKAIFVLTARFPLNHEKIDLGGLCVNPRTRSKGIAEWDLCVIYIYIAG